MEPLPETQTLLDLIWTGDEQLEEWLLNRAQRVATAIPECVGITIALRAPHDLTFTFVATDYRLRLVDGAQYLDGGPCEAAADKQEPVDTDVLNETRWQLLALAGAAAGVRSSLSFPIRTIDKTVIGSVNLYGAEVATFTSGIRNIVRLFGAAIDEAVANADLTMSGLDRARQSTEAIEEQRNVEVAIGVLAERDQVSIEAARQRLGEAAVRAGVPVAALAEVIVQHHDRS